ncbi:MAG: carbohydrate ABC transporter permease [Provencibacterium sp.]|jgi:raffinose/stachyose/melibiose transport system permease protein|nr:carbohydrate ABC transporter permease [Provencibacterium sp.]
MNKKRLSLKILIYAFLVLGLLLILFPMYLTVIVAFKTPAESAENFFSFPRQLYLDNLKTVVRAENFLYFLVNSVVITAVSLAVILCFVSLSSYAISRNKDSRYFRFLHIYFLAGIFVPFQVIMLPLVKFMSRMNLTNQTGIILLYITLANAQGVFLCVNYLKSIPMEMEEAAHIDGCSAFRTFFSVVFPLMKPILVTLFIMDALWIWNDFQLPLIMLNRSSEQWTLPLFQYNFKGQYSFDYNLAFASFLISMLPIMIVYAFLQRHIIGGLTDGAVKS